MTVIGIALAIFYGLVIFACMSYFMVRHTYKVSWFDSAVMGILIVMAAVVGYLYGTMP